MKTEHRLLPQSWIFVDDDDLRVLLKQDYDELRRLTRANAPKSTLVLCGSILEATLVAVLTNPEHKQAALEAFHNSFPPTDPTKAPPPIQEWGLNQLITVSRALGVLDDDAGRLAGLLKDYRNLIHPAVVLRRNAKLDPDTVTSVLASFRRILRSLSDGRDESPEARVMRTMELSSGPSQVQVATKILDWARHKGLSIDWKNRAYLVRLSHKGVTHTPISVITSGRVCVRFGDLKKRVPFSYKANRERLLHLLNRVPGVDLHANVIIGFPSIPLAALIPSSNLDRFVRTLDWIVAKIRQR